MSYLAGETLELQLLLKLIFKSFAENGAVSDGVLPPSMNAALLDSLGALLQCGRCPSKLLQAEKEVKSGTSG